MSYSQHGWNKCRINVDLFCLAFCQAQHNLPTVLNSLDGHCNSSKAYKKTGLLELLLSSFGSVSFQVRVLPIVLPEELIPWNKPGSTSNRQRITLPWNSILVPPNEELCYNLPSCFLRINWRCSPSDYWVHIVLSWFVRSVWSSHLITRSTPKHQITQQFTKYIITIIH
jgi:hypothetical protein